MKKSLLLILLIIIEWPQTQAQVAINSDGSNPDASAILDVKSNSGGLLLPRMTFEQRMAIQDPAEGLLIFCTDCSADGTGLVSVYLAGIWVTLDEYCIKPASPISGTHNPLGHQITWNWMPVSGAQGYKWNTSREYETAINCYDYPSHTQTGLGCGTEYRSFIWSYDDCGHSAYRILTQSTLDIPDAPQSAVHTSGSDQITWKWHTVPGAVNYRWNRVDNYETYVYEGYLDTSYTETGLVCDSLYTRYIWAINDCGHSVSAVISQTITGTQMAGSPFSGIHIAETEQITWNWIPLTGSTGSKWNTVNDYWSAIDMGSATSWVETGLTCGTGYTRYVWSYHECDHSSSCVLSENTLGILTAPQNAIHASGSDQITWNWHPVPGSTGYGWNIVNDFETCIYSGTDTTYTETSLECNTSYTRYIWAINDCGPSTATISMQSTTGTQLSGSPVQGTHISESTQITWSWLSMSGATGYKWNITNNYSTAIDCGTNTTHIETGLACGTSYTRYAWAYGPCWYSQPVTLMQSTLDCQGGGECEAFIDARDGQYYPVVQIGTQCWLGKNLNTGTMVWADEEESNNDIIEKHCYDDQSSNCTIYGGLYSREEMLQFVFDDNHGICPPGWHIPSVSEWNTLISYLGGYSVAGGKMKETGTSHWQSPNTGATNESGFTGLPGGQFAFWSYSNLHTYGYFWAFEDCETYPGMFYILTYYNDDFQEICGTPMESGEFSVRCIKNE